MKGILLAGGTGSRLWPITLVTSKQLLPVYDKPMIYYPLATLMLAGVRDILIITTPQDQSAFERLLGDGGRFGVKLSYAVQHKPEGLAQALVIGKSFLEGDTCLMILGDNIFHGAGLGHQLQETLPKSGAHIFTYTVSDPSQYGVLTLDSQGRPLAIEEKPKEPSSDLAVTGLYFFDERASEVASRVTPSRRGELEITSVLNWYLKNNQLTVTQLSRGAAWLDTGNPDSMHEASTYVKVVEDRTGLKIACIEEIALQKGWIKKEEITAEMYSVTNTYNSYLAKIIQSV